jgi:ABC-2 type transport system ATP-binding protein
MQILEAKGVVKKFAHHIALDNVDINIQENQIFGLLGPNGAGKTTLIRIINHITMPDKGILYFNGKPLSSDDIFKIGYLPEERGLYKKMKVGEQAMYLARLKGMSKHDAYQRLKYWFEKFEIGGWWNKKVEELSKGMQQKLQFIVTVIHEPQLLIFDEPFSGFDPVNANLLKHEILDLQKKGATIIFSTHNMSSVEELCDHIALINKAKIILDGNIEEIKQTYKKHEVQIQFTGSVDLFKETLINTCQIKQITPFHNGYSAKLKLQEVLDINQLISILLPHIKITGINELLPSMDEVFIQAIETANSINQITNPKQK